MGLEVCSGGKLSLEILYNCKLWNREWGVVTPLPRGSYDVGLWKITDQKRIWSAKERLCFQVGGWQKNQILRRQLVWKSAPLCEAIPDLYSITSTKGAMAADLWVDQGGLGAWDPKFLRPFND